MNINDSSDTTTPGAPRRDDEGFTLIEILLAIVLVGILAAVAVVGISNLVSKGSTSACQASADSAKAATAVYFAGGSKYPINFTELTTAQPGGTGAAFTLPAGASVGASPFMVATNPGNWVMTMTVGSPPTFVCTSA